MADVEKSKYSRNESGSRKHKVAIGAVLFSVIVLTAVYVLIAYYYDSHFFPGTLVNGINCKNADVDTVMTGLRLFSDDYQLKVIGRNSQTMDTDQLLTISGKDIEYVNSVKEADVAVLLKSQNKWAWPSVLWNSRRQYTLQGAISWNQDRVEQILRDAQAFQKSNMVAPINAYLQGYSDAEKQFVIAPETAGTTLDMKKVEGVVFDALSNVQNTVDLIEEDCYIHADITSDDPSLQKKQEEANKWLGTKITYDWNGTKVVLAGEQLKDWISIEKGTAKLDEEKVANFVAENAKANDTYRKNRTFHTTLGYDLDLPGGAFGWLTDREAETAALIELIRSGSVCDREPVYTSKAPAKGKNDIGDSYVEADMTFQHLYLYEKGKIVLETDFVSGNMSNGNKTPQGVFGLTYKTRNATLRGANYASFVHYWMPFNGNVGMHDATWRSVFGGDIYKNSGSHGCINLPLGKAAEIYPYMTTGFPIICYYYPDGVLSGEHSALLAASSAATVGVVELEGTTSSQPSSVVIVENSGSEDEDDEDDDDEDDSTDNESAGGTEAGTSDTESTGAGNGDAESSDAGSTDSGEDSGSTDTGNEGTGSTDGEEAGSTDAGSEDTGSTDTSTDEGNDGGENDGAGGTETP